MSEKGTEAGSQQHKDKARKKGDSVRSRELISAISMLAGIVTFGAVSRGFVHSWRMVLEQSLSAHTATDRDWSNTLMAMLRPAVLPVAMVMAASFSGALIAGMAQGGGLAIHPGALGFKLSRLNPGSALANMFSLKSATRVVKSMVPAAGMVVLGWGVLKSLLLPMPVMSLMRLPSAFAAAYSLALDAAWVTLAWSALDYAVEYVSWNKRMKMTRQQLTDEAKESQGNPHTKGRIRQVQNAMRRRKVKADISRASVIVTNPTHYAVALEFSFETMQAPKVLAKGRDLQAAAIREEARWAGIPMIENPPLARSLYRTVEAGQSIPFELYAAVAGILAYLYRQKVEEKVREERMRTARQATPGA